MNEATTTTDGTAAARRTGRAARLVLAAALVLGAFLFMIGARGETHTTSTGGASSAPTTTVAAAAEGTPAREAAEGTPGHIETTAEQSSEKLLGVNIESGAIVASVTILSLMLAGLALARDDRTALWAGGAFCALAAVADLHEWRIQTDRSKAGLAVIAATVAVVHVTGAIAAAVAAREAMPKT